MDYSSLSYEELDREYNRVEAKYGDIQDDCAKKGLSYDEFCEKAKKEKEKMYFIDKYMRLKATPTIKFNEEVHGEEYTFEKFKEMCTTSFTDYDGFGYYASEMGVSDIKVLPSDFKENIFRTDFSHIIWYNK